MGADKGYDTSDFVQELRELRAVLHVAQHTIGRRSAIDRRTARQPSYRQSSKRDIASRYPSGGRMALWPEGAALALRI